MKRRLDRTLLVLICGVFLTIVWGLIGLTDWAADRSLIGAGPGYVNSLQPIGYLTGAVMVSVSGMALIQHAHAAWKQRASRHKATPLRRTQHDATSATRRAPSHIATGRSYADLPAAPPQSPLNRAAG